MICEVLTNRFAVYRSKREQDIALLSKHGPFTK